MSICLIVCPLEMHLQQTNMLILALDIGQPFGRYGSCVYCLDMKKYLDSSKSAGLLNAAELNAFLQSYSFLVCFIRWPDTGRITTKSSVLHLLALDSLQLGSALFVLPLWDILEILLPFLLVKGVQTGSDGSNVKGHDAGIEMAVPRRMEVNGVV